ALVCAVFPDDARAFLCGCELSVPGQAGLTIAEIPEGHRLCELHRFNVIAAAVVIDDAFRRNDSVKGNAILIVAAVRSMHDEAPDAAGPKIVGMSRGNKAVGPPPLRQMLRICPHGEHQRAWRIERTRADD